VSEPPRADIALVTRMANGDDRALAALYDRHGGVAYSVAMNILGDAGDAEEAVSDAFIQVWSNAASFDPARSSVVAWLTMITRTRALDLLRGRRRRTVRTERSAATDIAGFAAPVADLGPSPERSAELGELSRSVTAAIAELPPPQRRALELAYFGGLSHSEIADELDEPLGTVKTRIRAGMEKLRAQLSAYVGVT
jgi:RNA polymerase sigma-70 factor (ECF subfamily)